MYRNIFVVLCGLFCFSKKWKGFILVISYEKHKEEGHMNTTNEIVKQLEEENRKLKEDNEMLLNIVVQMKVTLNRLVSRYVLEE